MTGDELEPDLCPMCLEPLPFFWDKHLCGTKPDIRGERTSLKFLCLNRIRALIRALPVTSYCSELFLLLLLGHVRADSGHLSLFLQKSECCFAVLLSMLSRGERPRKTSV